MSQFLHLARAGLALLALVPALVLADPPARVGRLALIENGVDFRAERDDAASPAAINWPISSGAVLETDRRGRAEVWIGSTAYRLASNSRTEFAIVDDRQVSLQVDDGSLAVSILDRDQADDVTVHTPDGSIRFATPGRYRIDVYADHSELSTQAGQAQLDDRGRITPVSAGQKVSFQSGGRVWIDGDSDRDGFDRWVAERENATLARTSRRHVSPYMTGYQDLDAYGDWRPEDEYGSVWYPRGVADDWAPYRFGRWAWVAPWGWTWIDQAPWGFAPFHYGRWVLIHGRWAWTPGRLVVRPVYAPALVGWLGNPGWSLSFGFGSVPAVGWFPLAPREVYVPAYRHSSTYVRQINVTHVHDVTIIDRTVRSGGHEHFAHRALPRAVTVVPANLLREGRTITPTEVRRAERSDLGRAPLAGRAPSSEWLAPPPSAIRTRPEGRREEPSFPSRRTDDPALRAQPAAPLRELDAPVRRGDASPSRREFRDERFDTAPSGAAREPGRDGRDGARPERQGTRDSASPTFRQEARPPAPVPQTAPQAVPAPRERDFRREMRDDQRQSPRSGEAPAFRMPEASSPAPAVRAPQPQAAPQPAPPSREREFRREMRDEPRQSPRASEAPAFRPQESAPPVSRERDFRRELRDEPRPSSRSSESPAFRPPETPQPAPAVRAPLPQAAPQPAAPPQREFRREMREEARPAQRPSEAPAVRPPPPPSPPPAPQAAPQPQPQAAPAPPESRGRERGRGGDREREERGERGR